MFAEGVELTTALTDLFNGIVVLIPIFYQLKKRPLNTRNSLWLKTLIFFELVCLMGFFLHGFDSSDFVKKWLWTAFFPFAYFMLGYYVLAVTYDVDTEVYARIHKPVYILTVVMSLVTMVLVYFIYYKFFTYFAIYALLNMVYIIRLLIKTVKSDKRYYWYLIGIIVFMVGSAFQMIKSIYFKIGSWEFNYNSIYHFFNLIFVLLTLKGMRVLEKK